MEGSLSYRLVCTIACSKCKMEDTPGSNIGRVLILSNVLIFREVPPTIPDTSCTRSHCLSQRQHISLDSKCNHWLLAGSFRGRFREGQFFDIDFQIHILTGLRLPAKLPQSLPTHGKYYIRSIMMSGKTFMLCLRLWLKATPRTAFSQRPIL